MAPLIHSIPPATLLAWEPWPHSDEFAVDELRFQVFLKHPHVLHPDVTLDLVAHMVYADARRASEPIISNDWASRPLLLYLCGGPGANNPPCRVPAMNRWLLRRGYCILYVNYRGCGDSSPVRAKALLKRGLRDDGMMAQYISHFCQDNIVRDLEAIRKCLSLLASRDIKWTILGQSYGGYISLTYLSMHPEGLQEVFVTGGLPPCGMDLQDYFRVEYRDIVAKNKAWYATYPDADALVRRTLERIAEIGPRNIRMTGRGYMTGQKLLTLGRQFGSKVGFPEVYNLLLRIERDLVSTRRLSPETIEEFENILHVDERPLYPLLLEQTWCSGGRTSWAAERVARELPGFEYLRRDARGAYPDPAAATPPGRPIYFTANTYCRFHYDTHEELVDLAGAAERLAQHDWDCPYDYDRLAANEVPVYAVIFEKDMHLDPGVAVDTAAKVRGLRRVVDPGWHQDIRYKPAQVLENLFRARAEAWREQGVVGEDDG